MTRGYRDQVIGPSIQLRIFMLHMIFNRNSLSKRVLQGFPSWIKYKIFGKPLPIYYLQSYSQEGEDLLLNRILGDRSAGFYIDIGAHHPKRFSNTYFFYLKNWHGINIDAMPNSMELFRQVRPNDINLELAIMKSRGLAKYYQFNEPALNGFSQSISMNRDSLRDYHIVNEVYLEGFPLSQVLDEHLPSGTSIDFLSIDVEGLDFDVIQSNNWKIYRPKVVLVEILGRDFDEICRHEIYQFMCQVNYRLYSKIINTVFFVSDEYFDEELC